MSHCSNKRIALIAPLPHNTSSHAMSCFSRQRMTATSALLAAPLFLLLAGCRPGGQIETLRLAHGLDASHPVHVAMEDMARRVGEASGGAMRVEIYPGGQLGSERECVELLQIGALDLTKTSAGSLEGFHRPFEAFSLPYLFRDEAHRWAVLEGPVGRRLLEGPAAARLRGLCYYDAGSRSFYTRNAPIHVPADLAGLKIRTQESRTAIRMVQALGGSATPIAWGELYTALQQGIVDGAENNPPSFQLSRHYEVCRHYSLDEHTAIPDVLLVSARRWERLDERERTILSRAAAESAMFQRELWARATQEAMAALEAAGVSIVRPDQAAFRERVAPLYDELVASPATAALVAEIRAVAATP